MPEEWRSRLWCLMFTGIFIHGILFGFFVIAKAEASRSGGRAGGVAAVVGLVW